MFTQILLLLNMAASDYRASGVTLDTLQTRVGIVARVTVHDTVALRTDTVVLHDTLHTTDTVNAPASSTPSQLQMASDLFLVRDSLHVVQKNYTEASKIIKQALDTIVALRAQVAVLNVMLASQGGTSRQAAYNATENQPSATLYEWVARVYRHHLSTFSDAGDYERVAVHTDRDYNGSGDVTVVEYSWTNNDVYRYNVYVNCEDRTMLRSNSPTDHFTADAAARLGTYGTRTHLGYGTFYYSRSSVQGTIISYTCGL